MSGLDFTLLDDYAQQLNRRDAARTSTALGLGDTQPNAAAEALEIARNLGVPPMAVVAQPDRFRADFQRFTNTNTLIDAPITRGWVDHDAMNAALAQDDLANLSGFERTVAEIALSVEGVGDVLEDTQAGRGVQTGISGVGQMATAVGTIPVSSMLQRDFQVLDYLGQLQDADPNLARHEVASLLGIDANSTAAAIAYDFLRGDEDRRQNHIDRVTSRVMANEETMTALVGAVNAYSAQMQETQGRMPNFTDIRDIGDFADWLSFNTGQAIPYMAATVLAGAIGGAPGVIGAGYGMGVGDIQSGLIEEGITDQGGIALAGGIPYAGLELLGPAARPFRGVGGDVLQEVAQGYLRRLGREFGENAVEEFINEAGQEIIRDYAVQAGGGEEVILNDETLLRWFNAGMAGAGAGGMMAAVSTSPVQRDIERADAAGGTAEALDRIDATVAASQLRQRAPDRFLDFANQTGAGEQLLYVPADGLREYAQARDLTDEDLEAWGVDVESLDQLAPSGGVVSVPMSNYAAMISGTDDAAWFRENATRREDEMSLAEAAAFNDQVQEVMQEAFDEVERQRLSDEELRASDVQIYDQVFSQLRAAGRSPDVAQNEARVWSAFWVTMGERYGEDPLDLARSMGVRIQSAMTPEATRRRNQTDVMLNELRRRGDAALRPRGMSILDFVMSEGGVMDPGGEVAMLEGPAGLISESRDQIAERQGQPNMLGLPSEARGSTMEDMARRVAEAGYWPDLMGVVTEGNTDTEVDLTQRLLDALSGELAGDRVYLDGEGPDANLTQLAEALSERGIDLADVTNDDAIAALEADSQGRTLFQDGYRGSHTAPMAGDGNASLADLTDVFGDDIYGPNAVRYYGTGNDVMDAATVRIMQSAAESPDQPVTIYRAVPSGVSDQINGGDWVTVNREYAQQHGEYFDDFDLIEMQALPHQIITDGNSIHEFGYDPTAPRVLFQGDDKRGSIVLPSGGVTEGQTIINLFEGADLSTVLHESGHFFYEAFEALASQDSAPQAMKTDLATLQLWMGVKPGERPSVDAQERMARGFERYVMEGKSPSIELASAFSRFKAWLTRIYRQVTGLNVNLTDEVREVFDRMLATDAAIEEAKAEASMRPLFREAPAGMTETDFRAYQRLGQKAEARAEQNLLERTMEKVRRRKEAWWKEERKATEAEVTESVNRRRAHRLVELLANGQWIGAQEGQDVPDMRIDRAQLVEMFGEGVLQEISRTQVGGKRAIYGDDGASPGEVAQFFGYENAMEMIEELQNTGKRKEVIKSETDRLMEERHGDPLNDGSIEAEAMDAIHSIQQGETIAAEARQLAKQRGQDGSRVNNRVFRYRAQQMVARMSVRDASRPQTFLAAERKAARVAERAFAKVARGGRGAEQALAEAYQAKEQQLLNHHLYMEAREVERLVERGRERMRNYEKDRVRKRIGSPHIEQIDGLLADYEFRQMTNRQIQNRASLAMYAQVMAEGGILNGVEYEGGRLHELNIAPRFLEDAQKTHYTRLSVEDFRGLLDTVRNLETVGRRTREVVTARRKRLIDESAARVAGAVLKNQKVTGESESSTWREAVNILSRVDTIAIRLDGGEEFGAVYDEIKREIDEGAAQEQLMAVEASRAISALFAGHYSKAELRQMAVERAIPNAGMWTKEQIVSIALNTGTESNFQRVMDHRVDPSIRMSPQRLDALLSTLDERDWRFVQSVWDMIEGYYPQVAEVNKRSTGVNPKKLERNSMWHGAPDFVEGGYYRLYYDPAKSDKATKDEQATFSRQNEAGWGALAQVGNGMTESRELTAGGRGVSYSFRSITRQVNETVRLIALSEAVNATGRILAHPEVRAAFRATNNADTLKTLELWLDDVASGPIYNSDIFNTAARTVKNNFTLSRLAFNMKTVILQATGLSQASVTIGHKNMAKGIAAYVKHPFETTKSVLESSPFMAERMSTFQKDVYDFRNAMKLDGPIKGRTTEAMDTIAKWGFEPIVRMQFHTVDMPTWLGAYEGALADGRNEQEAIHVADRMVARSQDSGLISDRAAIERGTVSQSQRQSDVIRIFTTLGGYMLTKMNRANVTILQGRMGIREADTPALRVALAAKMASDILILYGAEALVMGLMYSWLTDEDEPEDLRNFVIRETGFAVVGGIPVVRDIAGGFQGYGGGGMYGTATGSFSAAFQQVAQGDLDDAALRRSLDLMGLVSGLPSTASYRAIEQFIGDDDASVAEALFGSNPLTR